LETFFAPVCYTPYLYAKTVLSFSRRYVHAVFFACFAVIGCLNISEKMKIEFPKL
jgi:hypothetical protein